MGTNIPHMTPNLQANAMYVDHCWLSDGRLVVATSKRQLFILEANAVRPVGSCDGLGPLVREGGDQC